jgi:hypothetical protein
MSDHADTKLYSHARTIAENLISDDDIDQRLIKRWLHQMNAADTNIELIMRVLIARKDQKMAKRAAEQLQSAINDSALGKRYNDLLQWFDADQRSDIDPSSGAELVSEIVEHPIMVSRTDAIDDDMDAFDDDDVVLV